MWILRNSEGRILYLLSNKEYAIGRKDVDLALDGDQSVSRRHALLKVEKRNRSSIASNNANNFSIMLVDASSKYGTFVKGEAGTNDWIALQHGVERELHSGDTIRFGLLENKWKLVYEPLVVLMSNINNEEREKLRNVLGSITVKLTKTWSKHCTHLTMNRVSLTIKSICALASGKPIVLPTYWSKCKESIANNKCLPDYKEFIPPVAEPSLNNKAVSFVVNEKRSCIFARKLFVFASQIDLQELGCLVSTAGGTTAAFDEYADSFDKLCKPHVILVRCSFIVANSASTQEVRFVESFQNAEKLLISRGRRVISEREIGLAVLYCSTEEYCNPECHTIIESMMTSSQGSLAHTFRTQSDLSSQAAKDLPKKNYHLKQNKLVVENRLAPNVLPRSDTSFTKVTQSLHTNVDSSHIGSINASCDLFSSPIKTERVSIDEREIVKTADNRKRVRNLVLDDESDPKRHAPDRANVFSKPNTSSYSARNVSIKVEGDEEDLFDFPTDMPKRRQESDEEVDLFMFPSESRASTSRLSTMKIEEPTHANDTISNDVFENQPNSPLRLPQRSVSNIETEVAPVTTEGRSCKKRKTSTDDELRCPVKKTHTNTSLDGASTSSRTSMLETLKTHTDTSLDGASTSSRTSMLETWKTPISLYGFLNATTLKNEIDDLVDDVTHMILIEDEKLIVVRDKSRMNLSKNETENTPGSGIKNFKKFRKVLPVVQRILPRIIGGKDLYVYKEDVSDKWNDTPNESSVLVDKNSRGEGEDDDWGFPNVVKPTKPKKIRARKN